MPAFHAFEPAARIIVATLFNSLWEDALLALIVWAILRFATNVNATTRYALWISALVAAIVLPLVTTAPLVTTVTHRAPARSQLSTVTAPAAKPVVTTTSHRAASASKPVAASKSAAATASTAPAAANARPIRFPERFQLSVPAMVAVALFGVWALIALALMTRVLVGLVRLERLKSDSLPLPLEYREHLARWAQAQKGGRDVRLCVSDKIEVPVAVGLFDAMILIPQHLLDTLSQEEIDQITLHELAHLRRGDDWTNGLQRVIQSLFFFNPAILWMAQQLDLEREVACDDWVLLQTNEVRPYAFCLTKMAEVTAWPHRALAAPGVFVTRKSLSIRVERLLRAGRDIRTSVTFAPATIVGAMVIVLFFVLQTVAPSFAFADEDTTIVTSEPSATQPGKQNVTLVHRTGHTTEVQQFNNVEKGKIPERIIVTDRRELARLHEQLRAMPAMPAIPPMARMPKLPKTDTAIPPMPKIAPVPNVHVHMPVIPRIPVIVAYGPNGEQIRQQIKTAMKSVDVAAIATTAATNATQRALTTVRVARVHDVGSLNGSNCVGCDLSGVNWSGRDLRNAKMSGVDFSNADLHNVNFSGASLVGVDFSRANLRGVNFAGAKLSGCDLSGADLTGANLNVASFVGCDVDARHLAPEQARLLLAKCTGCDFHGVDLRNQDLRGVKISGDDLTDADLRGAYLDGAEFVGVDFTGAKFDGAHLNGTKFSGCDFDGADLSRVDLSRAVITGSKFKP